LVSKLNFTSFKIKRHLYVYIILFQVFHMYLTNIWKVRST